MNEECTEELPVVQIQITEGIAPKGISRKSNQNGLGSP